MTRRAPKVARRRAPAGRAPAAGLAERLELRLTPAEKAAWSAAAGDGTVADLVRAAVNVYVDVLAHPAAARYGSPGDLLRVALEQLDPDDETGELADLGREVLAVAERRAARGTEPGRRP